MPKERTRRIIQEVWDRATALCASRNQQAIERIGRLRNDNKRRLEANRLSASHHRKVLDQYLNLVADELEEQREMNRALQAEIASFRATIQDDTQAEVIVTSEAPAKMEDSPIRASSSPTDDDWPYGLNDIVDSPYGTCDSDGMPESSVDSDNSVPLYTADWLADEESL